MQYKCKFSVSRPSYVFRSSCSLRPLEERETVRLSRSGGLWPWWAEFNSLQACTGPGSWSLCSLLTSLKWVGGCTERERERISYSGHATQRRQQTVKDTQINHIFLTVSMDGLRDQEKKLNWVHGCWFAHCFRYIKIKLWGNPVLIG